MDSAISEQDLYVIERQLGRPPRGVMEIERRCRWGYPQVIKVYPLLHGEPFPTLFWLTCPTLIEQLSALEQRGYIKERERLLAEDEQLRQEYQRNHRDYIAERWAALGEEDRALVEERGLASALKERGIGGIADWERVKCLHLHYAHHLARENVIGRWLENRFQLKECAPEQIICDGFLEGGARPGRELGREHRGLRPGGCPTQGREDHPQGRGQGI